MMKRNILNVIAMAAAIAMSSSSATADEEECGECEWDTINPTQEPYCGGEILERHKFWAQTSFGEKRGPAHGEWRCGDCDEHQNCNNHFVEIEAALNRALTGVESLPDLINSHSEYLVLTDDRRALLLVNCDGDEVRRIALSPSQQQRISTT